MTNYKQTDVEYYEKSGCKMCLGSKSILDYNTQKFETCRKCNGSGLEIVKKTVEEVKNELEKKVKK